MKASNYYALKNVTIIDGTGKVPSINKTVVIKNGIIDYIVDSENFRENNEMETFDMSDRYIMPGMIDAHIHLFGADKNLDKELMTSDFTMQALRAVPQARKMMKYGFTALRDVTYNGLYLKRIFAEGNITGPKIVSSGPGINHMACFSTVANWETLDRIRFKNNWGMGCYDMNDVNKAIQLLLSEGADQIKVFANGSGCGFTDRVFDQHFNAEELKYIVEQAKKVKGAKVIAHIFDNKTAWDCLEAGVDTFEHLGFLDEELCDELVKKQKYLVPTATLLTLWSEEGMNFDLKEGFFYRDLFLPNENEDMQQKCAEDFKLAHKKGVKIALGTDTIMDSMTPYGEFSTQELKTMVALGMTPLEVIHSATQIGAEVLGLDHIIGTIEQGKLADILILKNDPTKDIKGITDLENIEYIIQDGKIIVDHGQMVCE